MSGSIPWDEIGKYAGMAIGAYFGGPWGAAAGAAIGERIGEEATGEGGGDSEEEITSGLSTAFQGYAMGGGFGGGSFGEGTSGIGPVADGDAYGQMLGATAGTSGVGPVADGAVYGEMLEGGGGASSGGLSMDDIDISQLTKQLQGVPAQKAANDQAAELDIQRLIQALQGKRRLGEVDTKTVQIGKGV